MTFKQWWGKHGKNLSKKKAAEKCWNFCHGEKEPLGYKIKNKEGYYTYGGMNPYYSNYGGPGIMWKKRASVLAYFRRYRSFHGRDIPKDWVVEIHYSADRDSAEQSADEFAMRIVPEKTRIKKAKQNVNIMEALQT